jgi:hypothetical protein
LVITFDWQVLGLSYFTCVYLLARPFICYYDLDHLTFDRGVSSFWKLETRSIWQDLSFDTMTLTLWYLTLEFDFLWKL